MNDLLMEGLSSVISLLVGALGGYCIAYVTGLRAVQKGMQLILRNVLEEMYFRFKKHPPTALQKRSYMEIHGVYEELGENGVINAHYEEVLHMKENDPEDVT